MKRGKVNFFYKKRNLGFIKKEEDNENIYFTGKDVKDKIELKKDDIVLFNEEWHGKKVKAIEVTKIK